MFSDLVRLIMKQSGRPDLVNEIVSHLNGTIRECQVMNFFHRDIEEIEVSVASLNNGVWVRPNGFRQMITVQYSNGDFPDFIELGRKLNDYVAYYYATSGGYAFAGLGGSSTVKLAYATYLKPLKYYPLPNNVDGIEPTEPAKYDYTTNKWQYLLNGVYVDTLLDISDLNPEDEDYAEQVLIREEATKIIEEQRRSLVSNWLVEYWGETLLVTGTCAKIFNVQNDRERATQVYAQYKQYQNSLLKSEDAASAGR